MNEATFSLPEIQRPEAQNGKSDRLTADVCFRKTGRTGYSWHHYKADKFAVNVFWIIYKNWKRKIESVVWLIFTIRPLCWPASEYADEAFPLFPKADTEKGNFLTDSSSLPPDEIDGRNEAHLFFFLRWPSERISEWSMANTRCLALSRRSTNIYCTVNHLGFLWKAKLSYAFRHLKKQ